MWCLGKASARPSPSRALRRPGDRAMTLCMKPGIPVRLVTLEESNGHGTVNTATFKNLVCCEEMANKTMYQTETNFKPVMKV
jgi:hypothetical protein